MYSREKCAMPHEIMPWRRFQGFGILSVLLLWFLGSVQLQAQCTAVIGSNINPIEGCDVLTVQFNDLSTGAVSRSWDFGDGTSTSTAQNPVHSYTAGLNDTSYTLKLSITCSSGSISTAQKIVTVHARPATDFSSDRTQLCALTDSTYLLNTTPSDSGNTYL